MSNLLTYNILLQQSLELGCSLSALIFVVVYKLISDCIRNGRTRKAVVCCLRHWMILSCLSLRCTVFSMVIGYCIGMLYVGDCS